MHRLLGTILICVAVTLTLGSSAALAYEGPQQFGLELRGGFGMYDMGDVTPGIRTLQGRLSEDNISSTLNESDTGPAAGFSFLYRPSRHTMWEAGFNALLDVDNTVETSLDSTSGQLLMHANEFFVKGNVVATLTNRIHMDFGAGVSYYNTELQVQDNYAGRYYYDAVGRGWGLIGTAGLEFLLTQRVGIIAQGGGRIVNTSYFMYQDAGNRTTLNAIGGTRPMEVNLSGAYANLGLRFYFDKVTKPVDFTR